jgi:hypothetical protein
VSFLSAFMLQLPPPETLRTQQTEGADISYTDLREKAMEICTSFREHLEILKYF